MKITTRQLNYIRYLRKIRQYWLKHELDHKLTQIQASYLIKKLLKLITMNWITKRRQRKLAKFFMDQTRKENNRRLNNWKRRWQ